MELTINKLLTLNNGEKYAIVDTITSKGVRYYYVVGIDEGRLDLNGVCKIVKISGDSEVEVVTRMEELSVILPLFLSHYADLLDK